MVRTVSTLDFHFRDNCNIKIDPKYLFKGSEKVFKWNSKNAFKHKVYPCFVVFSTYNGRFWCQSSLMYLDALSYYKKVTLKKFKNFDHYNEHVDSHFTQKSLSVCINT